MKKIELLAPAGSIESLYAAVQMGADAVYMGGSKFSARAYASNFDEENMIKAINYCHSYGVKIYITLNILIKQNEIDEVVEYVKFLYEIGVDALIIQDLGLASIIRKNFPDFEIHASTQMTIHNGEGAILLRDFGFKRIVLSRELSLNEIEFISKDLGIETEIFVHGALCICYSGQCLMSSMIGGRSGNRGRCAQPCRLPYTLIDRKKGIEKQGYALSPKDICTLEHIEEIINSGTASLKIEGRMKRPEYVAGVVESYRNAIDSVYSGKEFDYISENKKLLQLFNREGFSKAYLFGNSGKDMMAYRYPKNTGILIGKANRDASIILEESIAIRDGIRVREEGFIISRIIKDNKEVESASKGEIVQLIPTKYKQGDNLYKTADNSLLLNLKESYKNAYNKKINLTASVKFKISEPIELSTIFDGISFNVQGEVVEHAINKPLTMEKLAENIKKSGDTPFKFDNVKFEYFENGFLPIAGINSLRRELIDKIQSYINSSYKRDVVDKIDFKFKPQKLTRDFNCPKLLVNVSNKEQMKAALDKSVKSISFNPFMRGNYPELEDIKQIENVDFYIKVPSIIKKEFDLVCRRINEILPYIKGIITSNLGIIRKFQGKTKLIGDYKVNIFNSYAASFFEPYLDAVVPSVELNKKELKELMENNNLPVQYIIYGKTELMVSEYCPIGSMIGEKSNGVTCKSICESGEYFLRDRKNEEFVIKTDKFCRSYIYNVNATNLISNLDEIKNLGIESFRIDFINESYNECIEILNAFISGKWQGEFSSYTRGHFKRGVE